METYHFDRRAWNESYSGRTAKVGRPKTGLSNALAAAIKYANSEGARINVLNAASVAIAEVSSTHVRLSTPTLADLLAKTQIAHSSSNPQKAVDADPHHGRLPPSYGAQAAKKERA